MQFNKYRTFIFVIVLVVLSSACSHKRKITATNIQLNPIYGSNMVFKQGEPITLKGVSSKNGVLAVKLLNGLKYIQADDNGQWEVSFPSIDYKGSFSIHIEGDDKVIELNNLVTGRLIVVFGNGWLQDDLNSTQDKIALDYTGANELVRIYNPNISYSNNTIIKGAWKQLDIRKKKYREIYASILGDEFSSFNDGAVGIVNLSYPGSSVKDYTQPNSDVAFNTLSSIEKDSLWKEYFSIQKLYKRLADSSFKGIERDVLDRRADDAGWSETAFPIITSKRWYLKNRIAWLRKKIFISDKYITSDFTINLGILRGHFDFYFNGNHIDSFKGETKAYKLTIPDTLVKVWANLLTVRMVAGDSLSGFYSSNPVVLNADSSYKMGIAENWRVRTYYEPELPVVTKNTVLKPSVYEQCMVSVKGMSVNSLLFIGGIQQYIGVSEGDLRKTFQELNANFVSESDYVYLLPTPCYVDSLVNNEYYNSIRNIQLAAAAKEGWRIVNTLDIVNDKSFEVFQQKLVKRFIETKE